jgi:hypothetical protein
LWLDTEVREREELDSLEEDSFWNSDNRRHYHAVKGARVSQIHADNEAIYEYDDESDDGEGFYGADDDYID